MARLIYCFFLIKKAELKAQLVPNVITKIMTLGNSVDIIIKEFPKQFKLRTLGVLNVVRTIILLLSY